MDPEPSLSDLTVFAVEVKSSSDQLTGWQSGWLRLLRGAGVHVEILKVLD